MIEFGEWLPDLADQNNPGATEAKNVIPKADGYDELPALAINSQAGLQYQCRGAVAAFSNAGVAYNYAGDQDNLYRLADGVWRGAGIVTSFPYEPTPGTLTLAGFPATITFSSLIFTSVTGTLTLTGMSATVVTTVDSPELEATPGTLTLAGFPGTAVIAGGRAWSSVTGTLTLTGFPATYTVSDNRTYPVDVGDFGDYWEFAKWGNKVIAIGGIMVDPQIITMGDLHFDYLTGDPPKARHIAVVRDFVVMGNLVDADSTLYTKRVRWSGINEETHWTTNPRKQSDFQDLEGKGGWIQGIRGGEYGVIFQEHAIWRMDYMGPPLIFAFDETLPDIGTPAPNSIVQWGDQIFLLAQIGFMSVYQGREVKPLSANKINDWFFDNLAMFNVNRVVGALDRVNRKVVWVFPDRDSADGRPNNGVIYDLESGRWARFEDEIEWIYSAYGEGYTLEGLDAISPSVDALVESLDSRSYMGGAIQLTGFDETHNSGAFSGTAMTAVLETKEQRLIGTQRTFVSRTRPEVDGANSITVAPGTRNVQTGEVSWGTASSAERDGGHAMRADARYHRFRATITGGFTKAQGVTVVEAQPSGKY